MRDTATARPFRHPLLSSAARGYCIRNKEELRNIRRLKDLTLDTVAKEIGVTLAAVRFWETGDNRPTNENAIAWLEIVDPESLNSLNELLIAGTGPEEGPEEESNAAEFCACVG